MPKDADAQPMQVSRLLGTEYEVVPRSEPQSRSVVIPRRLLIISGGALVLVLLVSLLMGKYLPIIQSGAKRPAWDIGIESGVVVVKTARYEGLDITVMRVWGNTQFANDKTLNKPGTVRVNLQIINQGNKPAHIMYYGAMRLLVPGRDPLAPLNVQLPSDFQPYDNVSGWIDFPQPANVRFEQLSLSLGVRSLNESPVIIPFR